MNMRLILGWLGVVVVIIVAVILLVRIDQKESTERAEKLGEEIFTVRSDDHVKGDPETAQVTIIEYSDFQCPACATAYEYFKDIDTVFPEGVVFVYRHFPLTLIHRNADEAARATEAAALQGQFMAMHDVLFEQQAKWSDRVDVETVFADYAEELGMDRAQFIIDYKSDVVEDRVERDADEAKALGLSGTPTMFVDGIVAQLPRSKEQLHDSIRARLERAEQEERGDISDITIE